VFKGMREVSDGRARPGVHTTCWTGGVSVLFALGLAAWIGGDASLWMRGAVYFLVELVNTGTGAVVVTATSLGLLVAESFARDSKGEVQDSESD